MTRTTIAYRETDRDAVSLVDNDISGHVLALLRQSSLVAWDIETSGLDWANDRIATCQVYSPSLGAFIVRISDEIPRNLTALLTDAAVVKVFHHAMFDLRFMHYQWNVEAQSVLCTKIAAKILMPGSENTTLQALARDFLGVSIDKTERLSNWLSNRLSATQVDYAASDVIYLPALISELQARLVAIDRWDLAISCFEFLATRVKLDILGSGDVFAYQSSVATGVRKVVATPDKPRALMARWFKENRLFGGG